jgi:disulfide bond formation protein DsbB
MDKQQRTGHFVIFLISLGCLLAAYYFQVTAHLNPCILCIMQRICFYLLLATAGLAMLRQRRRLGNIIYDSLLLVFSGGGIYYASRQIWLQHLPPGQVSACPPSLDYLLKNFPLSETAKFLFYGAGDCGLVTWRFLGFSMAEYSLLIFVALFLSAVYLLLKAIQAKR